MINRPELKKQAKASLKNNWGYAIAAIVIYGAITAALSSTGIGGLFIGVFTLGYVAFFMAIIRGNKAKFVDLFCGFTDNFADSFVAGILISIFTFLWTLLFIIPGFVKAYSYSMTFYILKDNPGMSATEAITESRKMMDGHKWDLFVLHLSFLGWLILCALTFGILILYVEPYMRATEAAFYESIKPAPVVEEPVAEPAAEDAPKADAE